MEIINDYTKDGLRLPMIHYESRSKDYCIVFVHGMSGDILINTFAQIWAREAIKNDIGFLFGHTRGYSYMNDIICKNKEIKRYGTTYEVFEECLEDIDLFIKTAKNLGYKKLILIGHSLGCNKVIYYLSKNTEESLKGVVLASPPDMCGLCQMKKYNENYSSMRKEAITAIKENTPEKRLMTILWDEYELSARTFLSISTEDSPVDNLPLYKNPSHFEQLERIKVPVLIFESSQDDIIIRSVEEDLALIKEKATNSKVTTTIIPDTGHTYQGKEQYTADIIMNWINTIRK